MSLDITPTLTATEEARRQVEICNACRYCEGYCAVFPAAFAEREFADADITQLASLCHNCRGCYYACQYTDPHEFALNLPAALAEVRVESWARFAWPGPFARLFQTNGVALAAALVVGTALIFAAIRALGTGAGDGFYAYLSHSAMVAIFAPAFLFPLLALAVGVRRYWAEVGGARVAWADLKAALVDAGRMRNLSGGAAEGCNYEKGDRYSVARKHAHHAVVWGFLLCFASTSSGTVLHYLFDMPAPYPFLSLPKLLGVPGGLLLTVGAVGLAVLKLKADRALGAAGAWGGEMAFVILLGLTGLTGLMLYAATGTGLVGPLLALHLGTVLAFFVTLPYSKMAHAAYRLAALTRDAQQRRARG
ncbi:tricarballylate utilization 4Fe-4S protein TcuB [Roseicyclus persicicus]|uniref:Tricarballylate utilization 4Fe-4S protein TcuB n=1 Tax=Roseicyclus persicicus TaxID=2650661 RepID=A0A7X6JZ75_9RHOB|nr:tricarballylate utilization 4Fe-4S protein TcuB [Roseibacterium persicicum]NKX44518.1 tricarballylate utilization 4Fe-4S protein TcuB [Roseibacterium persicicum]